jgi:hypothetical protein
MATTEHDIAAAILSLRTQVRWKPGKDADHLAKRKQRGHLPLDAKIDDYNEIIITVLSDDESKVYRYDVAGDTYGVVWGTCERQEWLIIFGLDGVMETAFPSKAPQRYITRRAMVFLGKVEDILP